MKTKIGGQAVLEGVMMRGATSMALAVRDELGNIRLDTTRLATKKPWYRKVPFLRGIVNLITSMIDGSKIIGKSAEVMVEEVDTKGDGGMGWLMSISMLLGVVLALGLFVVLPTYVTKGIFALAKLDPSSLEWAWLKSLLEGVAKILILIGYMAGISQMKEIKRVFMYHGAEHKTIACYEAELPLTVENVQKCSRYHDRCGTSFIVFVVVLSVILMMVLDIVCAAVEFTLFLDNWWLRALLKIALLPVTAGISYEMLMLLACSNFILFRPLKWLGKQFQKLTTKEPDDSMCEVAIAAFNKVLEMDADVSIPENHFPNPIPLSQFRAQVLESGLVEYVKGDIDWLLMAMLNIKKEDLSKNIKIPYGWTLRLQKMQERIAEGEPWQYVVGKTEFYDRTYIVNKDVLIPRQETELVTEQLLKRIDKKSQVLDLCCGSGVIGITATLETGAKTVLLDISKDALKVAKQNVKLNKANVQVIAQSDMFAKVRNDTFDAIVCNPPYIETETIDTLDDSVKNFEPHLALDGGADGLKFYRILAEQAHLHLNKGGVLVLEIGYNQGEAVKALLEDKYNVEVMKDYGGNDRIVIATLK
ncbi:MAG: peptide chain release factor N(5)-glutamine methyltransferase [Clostridiales bacterium]|nr:peptide chain release factor N(5)-glutamine methyltransferase [Clostridiales bacterium]